MIMNSKEEARNDKLPLIGQRHVVTIIVFLLGAFLTSQRQIMSVTIVTMVNHTVVNKFRSSKNITICANYNETDHNLFENGSGEFNWDSQLQGVILGAHNFGYLFTMLPTGKMADMWGAKHIVFLSNLFSSLICIATPFIARCSPYALIVSQFLRGVTQGLILPVTFAMTASWYPPKERVLLSPWRGFGFIFGGIISSLVSGCICDVPSLGWPWPFFVFGGANLFFAFVFLFAYFDSPQKHPRISNAELKYITESLECDMSKTKPLTPWKAMFTSMPVFAVLFGQIGFAWHLMYFFSVHPLYLGTILHYSMTQNGLLNSLPMLFSVLGGFVASLISNVLAKHNRFSVTAIRKGCNLFGAVGFSICLLSVMAAGCDLTLNIVAFLLASFLGGVPFAVMSSVPVEMTPLFSGAMMGIIAAISTVGSSLLPVITGALTKNELPSEWYNVFILSAAVSLFCAVIFTAFGSAEIQPWNFVDEDGKVKEESVAIDNKKEHESSKL